MERACEDVVAETGCVDIPRKYCYYDDVKEDVLRPTPVCHVIEKVIIL